MRTLLEAANRFLGEDEEVTVKVGDKFKSKKTGKIWEVKHASKDKCIMKTGNKKEFEEASFTISPKFFETMEKV